MRPQRLDDIVGQDHIVGPGRLLRRAIQADRLSSVIFYGPPGSGKTSLAQVIANTTRSAFESLNAVLTGIKDIREVINRADEGRRLYGKRTILFVDEVHRWNKAQQDALLPWVENGTVIFIGATTENPFFEVNPALVSRSRIFQMRSLKPEDLRETVRRTLQDKVRGYGKWRVSFEEGALEHLINVAGGDARSLLNALELAVETSPPVWPPGEAADIWVSLAAAEESIQRRAILYDRDGDYHFDTISAFIKSVRGSDPDAALYWLAKMVRAGEDPSYILRRMIILASEDIGLADPQAIRVVISCAEGFERIGFPEGSLLLSEACLYLATAPKSNTALSFFDAMKEVEKEDSQVPNHLRDDNRDKEGFGHGEGYIYPHAYRDHWAVQQYLPRTLRGKVFYNPSKMGYEGRIREEVFRKREIQSAMIFGGAAAEEVLSWSSNAKGREGWLKRLESGRSALLSSDRNLIFEGRSISRHARILIPGGDDGLLLWESLRRTPEGLTAALVEHEITKNRLLEYTVFLEAPEKPEIQVFPPGKLPAPAETGVFFSTNIFDHIFAREIWRKEAGFGVFHSFAEKAYKLLAPQGTLVILQSPPVLGERISRILEEECSVYGEADFIARLKIAENSFFMPSESGTERWTWDAADLEKAFQDAGFETTLTVADQQEERLITERDLNAWFNNVHSSWGTFVAGIIGDMDFFKARNLLQERIKQGPLVWKWKSLLLLGINPVGPPLAS
jgi:putative ATPase